jgi:hypothetical protein
VIDEADVDEGECTKRLRDASLDEKPRVIWEEFE